MRLTIIKSDNLVLVEEQPNVIDCSDLPEEFHALQWYGAWGEVEFETDFNPVDENGNPTNAGPFKKPNERITDLAPYQKYIDAWMIEAQKQPAQADAA
jgi:hypothetical protein